MSEHDSHNGTGPSDAGIWCALKPEEALRKLDAAPEGLSPDEARRRLGTHGPNRIGEQKEVHWWRVLLNQFRSPLVYVLLIALAVTLSIGSHADAIVIGAVLVINSVVGFIQEFRAENSVQALMQMIAPKATVRRDNREQQVSAEDVVPGDLVVLGEGDVIPADMRLLSTTSLQINEAPLTGESVPVAKTSDTIDTEEDLPIPERTNMAFTGTSVTAGKGEGLVTATGPRTEIGRIAGEVGKAEEVQIPLQARIARLTKWIAGVILLISLAAFGIGWAIGRDLFEMLLLAVALSVAAIPAGLPVVVTVALAIGVDRMAKRNAVIRHLPAVDTLGSCTTILSDKTGTLTRNQMTVDAVQSEAGRSDPGDEPTSSVRHTLLAGMLCNEVHLPKNADESDPDISGDPMEVALAFAARKAGLRRDDLDRAFPRIDELPFQTEKRYMATIHRPEADAESFDIDGDAPLVLVKGAPEVVLDMCDRVLSAEGESVELDRDAWERHNDELAADGLRVLAMARGRGDDAVNALKNDQPEGLEFLGMTGLLDPPRPSAAEAVENCHRAGIRVRMVTGDHAATASAVARDVRIESNRGDTSENTACTGRQIRDADDHELDRLLEAHNTYARVEPAQKTRLVNRLKDRNEIVAVTGDGVNDAPALKNAHLGAAMGSGTDVAKEAGDMVITDDTFASVYAAVEQGRTAFRNIRMATFFLLSTGAADVLIILGALAMNWPLPLLPAQILWCNVVTNGIADVALAFEPGEEALYRRPPRPLEEGVLDRNLTERLVLVGIWLAAGVLGVFLWKWGFFSPDGGKESNLTLARTAALTTLVLFQKVHVFNCRSQDVSLFKRPLTANKLLLIGVLASLGIHIAAIHLPVTQNLLDLTPLDGVTWAVSAAVASTAILVNEAHKKFRTNAPPQNTEH